MDLRAAPEGTRPAGQRETFPDRRDRNGKDTSPLLPGRPQVLEELQGRQNSMLPMRGAHLPGLPSLSAEKTAVAYGAYERQLHRVPGPLGVRSGHNLDGEDGGDALLDGHDPLLHRS